jgi:hypothetical protein
MSLAMRILATIWIIVATAIWACFFYSDPFSKIGSWLFNLGYSWLAIGVGGVLVSRAWRSYRSRP